MIAPVGILSGFCYLIFQWTWQSPCKGLSSNQASLNQLSFPFFSFTRKGCSDLSSSVISPVMPLIPTCERLEKPLREAIYTAVFYQQQTIKTHGLVYLGEWSANLDFPYLRSWFLFPYLWYWRVAARLSCNQHTHKHTIRFVIWGLSENHGNFRKTSHSIHWWIMIFPTQIAINWGKPTIFGHTLDKILQSRWIPDDFSLHPVAVLY